MAERRMFAKTIIDSDAFLEMPQSSQNLYFHLAMRADDDGFINNPKSIMRLIGCKDDDANILIAKKFLIPFESGVVVIKHWKIHNYIRNDRYNETKYVEEKSQLEYDENGTYRLTSGIPLVDERLTQVRLGKVRLGKDRKGNKKDVSDETLNSFNIFWELYNRKVNKEKSLQLWIKIKPELYPVIYEHVKKYRETDSGKNFPYHPNNYLKGEHWNDDLSVFNKSFQTKSQEKSYREQLDERYPLI